MFGIFFPRMLIFSFSFLFFLLYFKRGNFMRTKVKLVKPTEIKDKKIMYQVKRKIRRKPAAAALKRHKAEEEDLMRLLKKSMRMFA